MNGKTRHIQKADLTVLVLSTTILIACLGAAGQQGRRRAKEMVCLANLRQWHAVFQGYVEQNDGKFFAGVGHNGYWWPVQLDEATQSWKKNRTWFCPTTTKPIIDENGRHASRFTTFNAWGIYDFPQLGPDGISGSYSLNGYTITLSDSRLSDGAYERGVPASDGWRNFESVPQAETVPLFLDSLRFDVWPLATDPPAAKESTAWSANNMARCAVNRHGGAVNSLFLDGAARKVGLKELWTLKWHRSFNTEGTWTTAGGAIPADWPEWMHGFQDY